MDKKKTEIVKLLKHKQETCTRLLEKMEEQVKAVDLNNDSRLSEIVEGKEMLIAGLSEMDRKIDDLVRELDQAVLESLVRENKELAQSIESKLEKIIEQETVCQTKLNLVKNEVLEKIIAVKNGQRILKGYGVSQRIKPKISKNI